MNFPQLTRSVAKPLLMATVVAGGFVVPALGSAETASPLTARMSVLEARAADLSQQVSGLGASLDHMLGRDGASANAAVPVVKLAQSRDVASLTVRMDKVEEQMRTLTGQIQGLQFQMTQLQQLIQKMQKDNEFRFEQLEGTAPTKKGKAAPRSGSVKPPAGVPQNKNLSKSADTSAGGPAGNGSSATVTTSSGQVLGAPPHPLGSLPDSVVQALDAPSGAPQKMNFDYSPNSASSDTADAQAQYKAGYDAAARGDTAFAVDQFKQFISLYPDDPRAPDAVNWLGSTLISEGSYDEAANILFSGWKNYKSTPRGPDILLRLGEALDGTDQPDSRDTACRTYLEVLKRYSDLTPAFKAKVAAAQKKAQC